MHADNTTDGVYIMLEDRLEALFRKTEEYSILDKMKGSTLVGKKYKPLFPYFQHFRSDQPNQGAFRIVRYDQGELDMVNINVRAW